MKIIVAITIATSIMFSNIPIDATPSTTGIKGSINRTWEAGKILLGACLLMPGFALGSAGAFNLKKLYRNPAEGSYTISEEGLKLGAGCGSLIISFALMESGFRNLRETRQHKK